MRPLLCRLLRARLHRPLFPSEDAFTARGASILHSPDIDAGEIAGDIDAMHGLRQHLVRVHVRSTQLPEGRAFDTDAAVQRNARGVGSVWAFNAVTAAPHEISRGWAVYRLVEYVCCVVCFLSFIPSYAYSISFPFSISPLAMKFRRRPSRRSIDESSHRFPGRPCVLWSTPLFAGATPAGAFIDFQICDDHYQVMAYSNRAVPLTSVNTAAPSVDSGVSSQPHALVSAEQHAPSRDTAVGSSRERRRPNAAKFSTAFVNADLDAAALKRREEDEDSRRDGWMFAANPTAQTALPNSSADDNRNSNVGHGNVRYRSALASAAAAARAFGASAAAEASSLTFDERAETHASLSAGTEQQQQQQQSQCLWAAFEATPVSAAMTSAAVNSLTAPLSSAGGVRSTAPPPSAVLISLQLLYLPERRETIVRSLELRLSLKWIDEMYGTAHAAHAARMEASASARGF